MLLNFGHAGLETGEADRAEIVGVDTDIHAFVERTQVSVAVAVQVPGTPETGTATSFANRFR